MTTDRTIVGSAILAVGLLLAGLFVGGGFARGRDADRYVTVKGVSEREAQADLAIWPLGIVAADNDLSRAHASLLRSVAQIKSFLARNQIDTTDRNVHSVVRIVRPSVSLMERLTASSILRPGC